VLFIAAEEIDWVEAADYYSCLQVSGKRHLIRRSMAELEDDLGEEMFLRIHRSAIVNLTRVRSLESGADGEQEVVLHDGTRLRLSRRCRKEVQARLGLAE
jgi:two-component system LytT family response regulator